MDMVFTTQNVGVGLLIWNTEGVYVDTTMCGLLQRAAGAATD
jgi:hypothetical protein